MPPAVFDDNQRAVQSHFSILWLLLYLEAWSKTMPATSYRHQRRGRGDIRGVFRTGQLRGEEEWQGKRCLSFSLFFCDGNNTHKNTKRSYTVYSY